MREEGEAELKAEEEPQGEKTIVEHSEPGPSYYVHDILLKDGTRCVVSNTFSSSGGTGIACDWKKSSVEK